MKKRLAALVMCIAFTVTLIAAPKAKATLAGAGAAAIGAAVLATYMAASGLDFSVDSSDTFFSGVTSMVTDYLADVQSTYTDPDSWLAYIGEDTVLESPGIMMLKNALTREIDQFVDWVTETFGLTEEGSEAEIISGSGRCLYNGIDLPSVPDISALGYGDSYIDEYKHMLFVSGNTAVLYIGRMQYDYTDNFTHRMYVYSPYYRYTCNVYLDAVWTLKERSTSSARLDFKNSVESGELKWTSFDWELADGSLVMAASNPVVLGDVGLTRGDNFSDIASEADDNPVTIFVPQTITKPDDLPIVIPDLIIGRELAPTYEVTQEGTDTDDPEEQTGIYIPALQRIQNTLSNLGQSIVDGIMSGLTSLFVPSEAYLEALPTQITDTFEERTGFLTYPFSLLPSFVDRLSTTSTDWILTWPQISEPFSGAVLFQAGSYNVSQFMRSDAQFVYLYQLYRLLVKVFMSFGFLSLCYNKYRSVVGDRYGGS